MRFRQLFWLSQLSALLLIIAWPSFGFAPIIFVAFIPLLFVEDDLSKKNDPKSGRKVFFYSLTAFLFWNIGTTWWIANATFWGGVMAVLFDTLLMTLTFFFFHRTKKRIGDKYSRLILISYWLTYEFIHLNWDLSFSWLMLGNVFSKYCGMVQWYEYTGAFGGSIWVLGVNLILFEFIKKYSTLITRAKLNFLFVTSLIVFLPLIVSIFMGIDLNFHKRDEIPNVVIVQPNIDPYNEKFSGNYQDQINDMIKLAETKLDSNVEFLVLPETALQESMWEDEFENTYSIRELRKLVKKYPKLNIITGASTSKPYSEGEKHSPTAHKFPNTESYYEEYNTALLINNSEKIQVYHKSKLVPFVEKTPFPSIFGFLEAYAIKMGGMSGSLGSQPDRTNFISIDGKTKIAPAICYESIYGDFIRQYVQHGANFICVITNDGWWGDTEGYRQHLSYASLRAIETRRCVVRCGNTGISCFIDEMGTQTQNTNYWEQAVIKARIPFNTGETFYVKHGDYLVYPFLLLSVIFCFYGIYLRFRK